MRELIASGALSFALAMSTVAYATAPSCDDLPPNETGPQRCEMAQAPDQAQDVVVIIIASDDDDNSDCADLLT